MRLIFTLTMVFLFANDLQACQDVTTDSGDLSKNHSIQVDAQKRKSGRQELRIVFFTPSDIEPPEGVKERIKEYVDYTQDFYKKWMKHWGYPCKDPLYVRRDKKGYPVILFVKGRHNFASGRYRQLGFQQEIISQACDQYKIDPVGQVWWSFIYKGPERRGFRGGGNAKRGGMSTSIYNPDAKGHLRIGDNLGSQQQFELKSKASIHELGHALGLPHIGPIQSDKLGNSLMGPVIKAYRKFNPKEERIYLTRASAAMLWKHPLFSGTTKDRNRTPKIQLKDMVFEFDKAKEQFVVKGRIVSDQKAHSIVLANEAKKTKSDYWRKCFSARVEKDGRFELIVKELDKTDGLLRIVGCFENGAIVGQHKGFGLQAGFLKQYHFKNGTFQFEEGWAPKEAGQKSRRRRRSNRRNLK